MPLARASRGPLLLLFYFILNSEFCKLSDLTLAYPRGAMHMQPRRGMHPTPAGAGAGARCSMQMHRAHYTQLAQS